MSPHVPLCRRTLPYICLRHCSRHEAILNTVCRFRSMGNNQKPSLREPHDRLCLNDSARLWTFYGRIGTECRPGLADATQERPSCYAVRKAMKETHYVPTSGAPRRIRAFHTGCHIAPCRRSDATIGPHRRFLKLQLPPLFRTVWAPARTPTRATCSASHRCTGRRKSARHRRFTALVNAGADPNARTGGGLTPLHLAAARSKTPEVVTALVNAGADPNARDGNGRTPLHWAASYRETGDRHGPRHGSVNAGAERATGTATPRCTTEPDTGGRHGPPQRRRGPQRTRRVRFTPLHRAAAIIVTALVTALVNAGADPNARTGDGGTPLHLAAARSKTPRSSRPSSTPARTPTHATGAAAHRCTWRRHSFQTPEVVTALVNAGAETRATGTASHRCTTRRHSQTPALVTALVNAGADLNARTGDGGTPLHLVRSKTPAVITALVNAARTPTSRDGDGFTPLHWAAARSKTPAVITALVNAGADPNARDRDGLTPSAPRAARSETPAISRPSSTPALTSRAPRPALHRAAAISQTRRSSRPSSTPARTPTRAPRPAAHR